MENSSGTIYKGLFHRGERHGVGEIMFPDKNRWVGEFVHGNMFKGISYNINGTVSIMQFIENPITGVYYCDKRHTFAAITKKCHCHSCNRQNNVSENNDTA